MWKVNNSISGQGYSLHVQDEKGRVIASVGSHDMRIAGVPDQFLIDDIDEIEKIATFIASAPDLLAERDDLQAKLLLFMEGTSCTA